LSDISKLAQPKQTARLIVETATKKYLLRAYDETLLRWRKKYQPNIYSMLHNSTVPATNSKTYPALDYTHVHQTNSYIAATYKFSFLISLHN
jgi:hypothetical protein